MSSYLYCYIERINKDTNQWENLSLYKKEGNQYEPVNVYGGSASGCGDLLCGNSYSNYTSAINGNRGIPNDVSPDVAKAWGDGEWAYSPTWYDYSELKAFKFCLNRFAKKILEHLKPEGDDVYSENGEKTWDSIICDEYEEEIECFEGFMHCVDEVLQTYGIWYPKYGEIRIILWCA